MTCMENLLFFNTFIMQHIRENGEKHGNAGHCRDEESNRNGGEETEPADGAYAPLRSEDSGLGISASPSEQQLPPVVGVGPEESKSSKDSEKVWRRGGSVDSMAHCLQDIMAFINTR